MIEYNPANLNIKNIDFVFEDDRESKKYIGEITSIYSHHYIEFYVNTGEQILWCGVNDITGVWRLDIMTLEVTTELSTPDDTFWNSERIIDVIKDYKTGIAVAVAINKVYRENRHLFE